MKVQIWQSFSCNNSSSYYLVARFQSAETAASAGEELTEFLVKHAKEVDENEDELSYDEPSQTAKVVGEKYGFEWERLLGWGDERLSDWLPTIECVEQALILSHRYCGGFGESVPEYLRKMGAETVESERSANAELSFTLRIPESAAGKKAASAVWAFAEALEKMRSDEGDDNVWTFGDGLDTPAPWGTEPTEDMEFECGIPYPCFNDGEHLGLILEVGLESWSSITGFFDENGITDYHVEIDRPVNRDRFRAIATASCPECKEGPMRYLAARSHEAPTDQLACKTCGGMFELSDLVAPG